VSINIGFTIIKSVYYCPWCESAEDFIKERGYESSVLVLPREELLPIAAKAKMHSVPIIYHGSKLIGGYEQLTVYMAKLKG
jgi:glutaredoxin